MSDSIFLIIIGVIISVLGIINCFGYIETIHKYNRKRVTEENRKPYGRTVGSGTLIIGLSIIIFGILYIFTIAEWMYFMLCAGCIIGAIIILYGQFKYNKGIF